MLVEEAVPAHVTDEREVSVSSNALTSPPTIVFATPEVTQLRLAFAKNISESEFTVMVRIDTGIRVTVSTASIDRSAFQAEHPPAINRPSTVTSE